MPTMLAPAKVNLLLEVGPRGSNGLHELVSVMQSVSLYDEVSIEPAGEFSIAVTAGSGAPADDTNLALRATRAFAALHFDPSQGVALTLAKRIPAGGGLGGASSDAAAVLVGLNEATGGAVSRKAIEKLAVPLGSDVPFCVRGGTCVVEGTGERLTTLPVAVRLWWVVGMTGIECSTGEVYRRFDELTPPARTPETEGAPHAMADALARGDLEQVAALVRNDLESAALDLFPDLQRGWLAMQEAGPLAVVLAGSGSSWLALARDEQDAQRIASACQAAFVASEVVSSLSEGPVPA